VFRVVAVPNVVAENRDDEEGDERKEPNDADCDRHADVDLASLRDPRHDD
jgi:hypothetical protein